MFDNTNNFMNKLWSYVISCDIINFDEIYTILMLLKAYNEYDLVYYNKRIKQVIRII